MPKLFDNARTALGNQVFYYGGVDEKGNRIKSIWRLGNELLNPHLYILEEIGAEDNTKPTTEEAPLPVSPTSNTVLIVGLVIVVATILMTGIIGILFGIRKFRQAGVKMTDKEMEEIEKFFQK